MGDLTHQAKSQTRDGFSLSPSSDVHLLCPNGHKCNETFVCTSEIDRNGLQDLVEDHLDYMLGRGALCVLKESGAGHGGAVDFLAFDRDGLVFLVEVKRAVDQRAKFDVIFQVLKYISDPAGILRKLSSLKPDFESRLAEELRLSPEEASELAKRARANIERLLMNPVIVVDEASYPLIASARALQLRGISGSEFRLIEVNLQRIRYGVEDAEAKDFVYVRKYFSNDMWVGNKRLNNRKPTEFESLHDALARIPDPTIRQKVDRLREKMGVRIARVATSGMSFTLVEHKAYFTFDPNGTFAPSMFPRTVKPKYPYGIVVVEENPDTIRRLTDARFIPVPSHNGKRTYRVFDLKPSTTDKELDRLAEILRELS
jgi:hypothetical protein